MTAPGRTVRSKRSGAPGSWRETTRTRGSALRPAAASTPCGNAMGSTKPSL